MRASSWRLALASAAVVWTVAVWGQSPEPSDNYINYASEARGASISSPSAIRPDFDLRTLIGRPAGDGDKTFCCVFADRRQRERFTIDLGQERRIGRIIFRARPDSPSFGPDPRFPNSLTVKASTVGPDGPWAVVIRSPQAHVRQSLVFDDLPARWLLFDLGFNRDRIGSRVAAVEVFPPCPVLSAADLLRLRLARELRRDWPGLQAFWRAADAGEWERAARELLAYYAKDRLVERPSIRPDLQRANENTMANRIEMEGVTVDFGDGHFDWHCFPAGVSSGPPSNLAAGFPVILLANAYRASGDPKYAETCARLLMDWLKNVPNPKAYGLALPSVESNAWWVVGHGSRRYPPGWAAIRVANRVGYWDTIFRTFVAGEKGFTPDVLINLLCSIWEQAEFLANVAPILGGNWLTWSNDALVATALRYPEFARQPQWIAVARRLFETGVRRDVFASGKEKEDSSWYTRLATGQMLKMFETLRGAGAEFDPEIVARINKMPEFVAWAFQPDFSTPCIGDTIARDRPKKSIPELAFTKNWDRPDLKYIQSAGREGTPPAVGSRAFLPGGWHVLRSEWGDGAFADARHMVFRAPPADGRGHGHKDVLALTLYAYGRALLIDPGMTVYGRPDSDQFRDTRLHNALVVDGKSQAPGPGIEREWATSRTLDFADAEHRLFEGVVCRRQILFAKPEYWIVRDTLTSTGPRRCEQFWRFVEGAQLQSDPDAKAVWTCFAEGENLLVLPVNGGVWSVSEASPYATSGDGVHPVPAQGWRYSADVTSPFQAVTVLYPYVGAQRPALRVRTLEADPDSSGGLCLALELSAPKWRDYAVLADGDAPRSFASGRLQTDAHAVHARRDSEGRLVRLERVGGGYCRFEDARAIGKKE